MNKENERGQIKKRCCGMGTDEGICLLLEIKKEDKGKRGQWEGGEAEDPALWDSSVCFGGGQSDSVCRTSPDTNRRDAASCTLCVCVHVCVVKPDLPLIPVLHTLLHLLPSAPSALRECVDRCV